ncbi:RIP metalloprotease RseP [Rhodovulum adriaticum]|uniref:Zinc metalloprotease n=1 Tax=Rhodovulum adriaticum TaxID=35804 RepID=A0A4R2NTL1_RHOAD|nr:RIP metalloprotease RseP [Rhodovulum adriaticum]MBK1635076.1 RIP metalloprotease RseP [Rhodovulum adriaticum]TCP25290.1 regulator of sigma E protease [Rhodovulum adriaticum]
MDILSQIPTFGNVAFTLVAFVVALSIIVTIHEYGHYIVARWSGIHSEVFSLGFGPVLFSREDQNGTRWQIAALPLGGYVRFLGDADAASGKSDALLSELDDDTRRHTMHGAPLWARTATVAAGPLFNFALSILIFAGLVMFRGEAIEPPTVGQMAELPAAAMDSNGLQPGDRIVALGGVDTPDFQTFYDAVAALPLDGQTLYTVEREGQRLDLTGPYPFPPLIQSVQPGSAAAEVGLKEGDVVRAVDGQEIIAFSELQSLIAEAGGTPVTLRVWRDGTDLEFGLTPRRMDLPLPDGGFEQRWLIGMTGGLVFDPATRTPGPWGALVHGVDQIYYIIQSSLSALYHMVTGAISSCNLSGPIGIAESSGAAASQGALSFIWFIAMLSTAVGLLNLFPIPVLDGGHLVFYAYEAVTGRPPSDRAIRVLMTLGLSILLALMAFALSNDILCP